jgi:rhodanese-related sulfurtransferase
LLTQNYPNVKAILGGLDAWQAAGYPISAGDEGMTAGEGPEEGFTNLSLAQFQVLMEVKDFPLINVHVPFEGNIPGTDLNIPYDEIAANLDKLPADKDAKMVLYCKSNGMSLSAIEELAALGYSNLFNLDGGFTTWQEAGLALENE